MTGRIFISYRRDDAPGTAGRLHDLLVNRFGPEQLFFDVDSIEIGSDFLEVLKDQVAKCDVLIAVIGPRWLEMTNKKGLRRLDDPEDPVRIEIETAFDKNKRLIPVLIGGARMPTVKDLPASLAPLATRNATRLSHERFLSDSELLVTAVKKSVTPVGFWDSPLTPGQLLLGSLILLACMFAIAALADNSASIYKLLVSGGWL